MRYDDDGNLVKSVLDGDKDAFVFLVDRYQGAVYAYCLNKLPSEEDAKDVTQEVLLKAYLKLGQLKTPHAFRSWLYTIASNECRMWHRKHQSHEALESAAETATMSLDSDLETRLTVKEEIDALPESQRLVILMHYFSGFSLKEIGEFLGTSREAIKARLFRARQRLGKRLKGTFEEYFDSSTKPNFCVSILDKIAPLPKPSVADSPVSNAHRLAPLPLAAVLSVMLFGGLAGLFPTGMDSGASEGAINVSLIDPDSDIELAQADVRKKQIDVSVKPAKTEKQKSVGSKTGASPLQVIGGGRVDDIVASPDGKLFAIRTPFGLELHRPDANGPPVTVDTTERIESPTFSRDGRFLVWNGDEQVKVWDVEEQGTVAVHSFDFLKRTHLFNIGLEFATELDNKVVSDDLESVFEEHGIRLKSPYFPRGAPRWRLAHQDGRHIFDIREIGDKLGVYASHKRRWLDRLNIALHPKMKEVALALPWQGLNESAFKLAFVDPVSGEELRSYEYSDTHGFPIHAVRYSPDGERLVVFEHDKDNSTRPKPPPPRIVFLNPKDGEVIHTINIPDNVEGLTFAYSPGSQWFAYRAWRERRVDVLDTHDWQVRRVFTVPGGQEKSYLFPTVHPPDPKTSISFSPDSRYLALGAMVWDFRTGDVVHPGVDRASSQFLDDTHLLISDGSSVRTLDVEGSRLVERVKLRHGVLSWTAHFLPDGDTILAQGWWHTSIWKASAGRIVDPNVFAKRFKLEYSVASPINDRVASIATSRFPDSGDDASVHIVKYGMLIWSAQKREVVKRIFPDFNIRFSGSATDELQADFNRGMLGTDFHPYMLAFNPNGDMLAVGHRNGIASVWDISEPRKLHRFDNFATSFEYGDRTIADRLAMVSALAFNPDGNQLACGVFDAVRIWDVNTGEPVQALKIPNSALPLFLRFSKDGKRLFAGLISGDFVVFNAASGMVVRTLNPGFQPLKAPQIRKMIPVDLNPDTTLLAVGRTDYVIELIETQGWQSVAEFKGHRGDISSLDFSHDGTKLLSKSNDGTMRVWKVEDF